MSPKKKKGYDRSVYHSFAMVMQFGINMLVPICALSALGIYIDKKLGTSFVMIILFFAGAAAGARNVYRMAKYSFSNSASRGGKNDIQTDVKNSGAAGNSAGTADQKQLEQEAQDHAG